MQEILVGLIAVAIGALLCFRGYLTMRVIIPFWGFFAGFITGAGLVAALAGENFLASVLGWIVGLGVGMLFMGIAYLYYEISVVIGMGAIGFSLGASATVALGITWSWLIILAGLALAVVLAVIAIMGDLPSAILTVLTAMGGATAVVFGIALLFGTLDLENLDQGAATELIHDKAWAYIAYLSLVVAGIIAQLTFTDRLRRSMREQWYQAGGHAFIKHSPGDPAI